MAGSRSKAAGRRLVRDRAGATAVEFALVLPMLALLLAGLIDVSRLVLRKLEVQAAAQAGADYVRLRGWDLQGVAAAVTAATPLAASATPAPQLSSGCVSAGAISASSSGVCANGAAAARFATISAQAPFAPLAPWPGFVLPRVVTAQAMVRLP